MALTVLYAPYGLDCLISGLDCLIFRLDCLISGLDCLICADLEAGGGLHARQPLQLRQVRRQIPSRPQMKSSQ